MKDQKIELLPLPYAEAYLYVNGEQRGVSLHYRGDLDLPEGTTRFGLITTEQADDRARAAIEADRQRRGEPVAYIRASDLDRLKKPHIAGCAASLSKTAGDGFVGIYKAPQPAEPTPTQKRHARLRADPVKAAALDRAHERIAVELSSSDGPVRPKEEYKPEYKYCEDGKVVWTNAADAPVVKSAEPVKVPSDADIDAVFNDMPDGANGWLKSWGYRQFARDLLARYGQPASGHSAAPMDTSPGHSGQTAESEQPYPEVPPPDVVACGESEDSYSRQAVEAAMRRAHDRGYSVGWDHGREHSAQPAASAELVAEVRIENDYWRRGHFYKGSRKEAKLLKAFYDLPVGASLYAVPVAAQPSVPDGWKLVPLEPTDEMYKAWLDGKGDQRNYWDDVYKAMLAAAPTPPADGQT